LRFTVVPNPPGCPRPTLERLAVHHRGPTTTGAETSDHKWIQITGRDSGRSVGGGAVLVSPCPVLLREVLLDLGNERLFLRIALLTPAAHAADRVVHGLLALRALLLLGSELDLVAPVDVVVHRIRAGGRAGRLGGG